MKATKILLRLLFALVLLGTARPASAQHGTAGNGYFPPGYSGDTWTGVVISSSEQTGEITLSYTDPKNGKTETFVGTPEKDYLVHEHGGSTRPLRMSDIPVGRVIKVWYKTDARKIDGKKVTVNVILQISIAANANRKDLSYKAFGY